MQIRHPEPAIRSIDGDDVATGHARPALTGAAALLALAAAGFGLLWWADGAHPVSLSHATSIETLSGTGEVTVGVLGIAITVVAILVELAANRYTPRISELFVRDRTNQVVMSGFVVASVIIIWVDLTVGSHPQPAALTQGAVALMTASLVALLPYFAYVFDFLSPTVVVRRIADRGHASMSAAARTGRVDARRTRLREAIEQLGDIATNAIEHRDKSIAFAALAALDDLMVAQLPIKGRLPPAWFERGVDLADDADFVALDPTTLDRVARRRTWVELKILRQFQALFGDALHQMRDVAHLVAVHTRRMTLAAFEAGDAEAGRLCIRFLNTYLRAALNARDVRTGFHLLHEVRLLAEALLDAGHHERAVEVAGSIKFYGQVAFAAQIPFLLETAAHDIGALIERAAERHAPSEEALLAVLLDVDREPDGTRAQETSLRGVRRAQVKVATWYLAAGRADRARRIAADLHGESPQRLAALRADLEAVTDEEYHEMSDRGVHFDWLPPERRAHLAAFFAAAQTS
jgi:hypothetical protein